jgi:hypothetical protein
MPNKTSTVAGKFHLIENLPRLAHIDSCSGYRELYFANRHTKVGNGRIPDDYATYNLTGATGGSPSYHSVARDIAAGQPLCGRQQHRKGDFNNEMRGLLGPS